MACRSSSRATVYRFSSVEFLSLKNCLLGRYLRWFAAVYFLHPIYAAVLWFEFKVYFVRLFAPTIVGLYCFEHDLVIFF